MSTTDPPPGSSYAFSHDDPAEADEEQRARPLRDRQDRIGEQERELPGTARNLAEKADQIVKREEGVRSFRYAEETDQMERPPSIRDRDTPTDAEGNAISDAVANAWETMRGPDADEKERP